MSPINLLPPELKTRARTRRVFAGVIAAAVVVLLFLGVILLLQRNRIGNEEEELEQLQATAGQLRGQVAQLAQFGALKDEVDATRASLAAALTNDVAWSRFMNDLSIILPDNSWLVNVSLSASPGLAATGEVSVGTTTFQGFVFDFPGLAGWLTRMEQMEGLTFVYLTTGSRQQVGSTEVVSFGANASLTQNLLSLRCQEEGKPCP